jgi:hypothetical protein
MPIPLGEVAIPQINLIALSLTLSGIERRNA